MFLVPLHTSKCTTLENARIQLPSSASAVAMTYTQPKDNDQVWCAGELAESGKVFKPRIDGIGTVELYPPKKVFSGARDPRLGNEATLLEGFSFSAQEVDNGVGDFWW